MLAGFSTSNSTAFIPGLAFVVSSKWLLRRPEMMTSLPSLWSVWASPRPIPEPPPVTKIVFPVSFIVSPLYCFMIWFQFACSCGFDSQEENHTATGQLLLTKRSDFRSAKGLVRCSPFGGVHSRKQRAHFI